MELLPDLPQGKQGSKHLSHLPLHFLGHQQGARLGVEQPEHKLVSIWAASIAGGSFTLPCHNAGPGVVSMQTPTMVNHSV